ncbi:MAG TPA: hypothetical protein VGM11_12885 [Acidobacteriaceae bacterium]|jgi:hypothetical protein
MDELVDVVGECVFEDGLRTAIRDGAAGEFVGPAGAGKEDGRRGKLAAAVERAKKAGVMRLTKVSFAYSGASTLPPCFSL